MMKYPIDLLISLMFRSIAVLLSALLTTFFSSHALAASLPRDTGAYAYYAENAPVTKVLADFCANFGLRLQLSPNVNEKLNGRLTGTSATDFLNRVSSTIGLSWFYYAGNLYVAPLSDWHTRTFSVPKETIHGLKKAMTDLGVLNDQFGWAMVSEQGLVLLTGPTAYLDLVANTLQSLQSVPVGQQVAVFRLKYANVEDRTLVSRDRQTTIPGVATILRALINGHKKQSVIDNNKAKASIDVSGLDAASAVMTNIGSKAVSTSSDLFASSDSGRSTIESDVRLNAIIVKDTSEAMPMYQKLIAALDVPAGLIEIEAMTIDINKTRLSELGMDWALGDGRTSIAFGDASKAAVSGTFGLSYSSNTTTIVANQAASLLAKVRLLETKGDARVIGKPSILTTDNLPALIDLSQTFYVKVAGERVANLDAVTTGVMLRVTPRLITPLNSAREVQLVIDIEDGTLVDRTGLDLPVVQRSVISTQATILENQSLLIAGHDTETESEHTEKVPGLSNLPVLGGLFSNKTLENQQRKRLFLITPRIINQKDLVNTKNLDDIANTINNINGNLKSDNVTVSKTPAVSPSQSVSVTPSMQSPSVAAVELVAPIQTVKVKQVAPTTQAMPVIQEVVLEQPKIVQKVQVGQPIQKQPVALMQAIQEKKQEEFIQSDSIHEDAIVLRISDRTVQYRQQRKSVKRSEKKSGGSGALDTSVEELLSAYSMFKMSTTLTLNRSNIAKGSTNASINNEAPSKAD